MTLKFEVDDEFDGEKLRLRVFDSFAVELIGISDQIELAWYVAREVVGSLGFDDCVVYYVDPNQNLLRQIAAIGDKNPQGNEIANLLEIKIGDGVTGKVAKTRQPLVIDDLKTYENYIPDLEESRSEICVPLVSGDQLFGVIDCEHPQPGKFGQDHLNLLTSVAALTSAKLELIQKSNALQQSETRFRLLFDNAEVSIWDEDFSAVILELERLRSTGINDLEDYLRNNLQEAFRLADLVVVNSVNDATLKLYGANSPEEFIHKLSETLSDDTISVFIGVVCAMWNNEEHFTTEVAHKSIWGEDITVILSLPIPKRPEDYSHVPVCVFDISERKSAETLLHQSEERFREFAESSSDWLWEIDAEGRIVWESESASDKAGRVSADVLGMTREEIAGDQMSDEDWLLYRNAINEHLDFEAFEYRYLGSDNVIHFAEISGKALFDDSNRYLGHRGTASDITKRKVADEALRESEEKYRTLTSNIPGAVYRCAFDDNWTTEYISNEVEQILGYPPSDFIDSKVRPYASLIHPDHRERVRQAVVHAVGDRLPYIVEYPSYHADGSIRWIYEKGQAVFDENDEVRCLDGVFFDITERHLLEESLRRAQKMEAVGQLTGGIAHEFNNLLQVVSGNIGLLEDNLPANFEFDSYFDAVNRNVKRGAELTDRLLSFSRSQPLSPKRLDIAQTFSEMQKMLEPTLGETVGLRVELLNGVWAAKADPGQLENALLNLALNARDAMPNGGIITLSAENVSLDQNAAGKYEEVVPGDYVMLSVIDGGNGMTEEVKSRAFEPFYTTKDVGKGTGLGLSMVYGFAQQSGGFAEIESEPGQGAKVNLYLPRLISVEDDASAAQEQRADMMPSNRGTILLVEDDDDVRQSLAAQLTNLGYLVLLAADGAAAMAALADGAHVDLLFTDVVMPGGLSGLELAKQLLVLRPDLKVLYTTGYSDDVVAAAGQIEEGAIVLRKPYDKTKLVATISQVLT